MNTRLYRFAGWTAILSGIAGVVALVTTILFFALEADTGQGHVWGPLSDLSPIVQMALLLIVARALYGVGQPVSSGLSLLGTVIGIAGMLGVVFLQTFLIMGIIPFEQEVGPVVFATGLVGVWMIVVSLLGRHERSERKVPSRLAWLGVAVGIAYVLEPMIVTMAGGADLRTYTSNPLLVVVSAIVFLTGYVGFPVWAIGLGRMLLVREVTEKKRSPLGPALPIQGQN